MNDGKSPLGRLWAIIFPPLLFLAVTYAVEFIWALVLYVANLKDLIGITDMTALYNEFSELVTPKYYQMMITSCLITLPLLLFFLKRDCRKRLAAGLTLPRPESNPWLYGLTFLTGIGYCLFANNLLFYSRLYELAYDSYSSTAAVLYQGKLAEELILTGLLSPLVEELIFRGLLYGRLRDYYGVRSAVILSALYFGFYHGNLAQGIYAGLLGVLAAWLVERFGSLLPAVLLHMGANLISVFVSETYAGQAIYQKEGLLLAVTAVAMLLILGCMYVFLNYMGQDDASPSA